MNNLALTPDPTPANSAELQSLRESVEMLRMQHERAALEHVLKWQTYANLSVPREGLGILEGLYSSAYDGFTANYVDPRTPFFDTPGFREGAYGLGMPLDAPVDLEDTKDGAYKPFWVNHGQYRMLQGTTRWLAAAHQFGANILGTLADYGAYQGFTHKIEPKTEKDDTEATAALCEDAQEILDECYRRHQWKGGEERRCVTETEAGGEFLIWVRHIGGGKAKLIEVPREQIVEPQKKYEADLERTYNLDASSWSFGVVSAVDDSSDVKGFFWDRDHTGVNYDFIPIDEAVWWKINAPPRVKRGMTSFYPVIPLMRALPPACQNVIIQTAIQSSIALVEKSQQRQAGGNFAAPLGSTGGPGGLGFPGMPGFAPLKGYTPGGVHSLSGGLDYEMPPLAVNTEGFLKALDAGFCWVGATYRMPRYMITGMGDEANRATAETQEQPMMRCIESRIQPIHVTKFSEIDRRVLLIAILAGRLRQHGVYSLDDFDRKCKINVSAPSPKTKDEDKAAETDMLRVQSKLMSKRTAMERGGLDADKEMKRLREESADEVLNPPSDAMQLAGQDAKAQQLAAVGRGPAPFKPKPIGAQEHCGANAPGGGGFIGGNSCASSEHRKPHAPELGDTPAPEEKSAPAEAKPATIEGEAPDLMRLVHERGGFTVQPLTGVAPKTGFAVSAFRDAEFSKPMSELTADDFKAYLRKHRNRFNDPRVFVGGWHDKDTGLVYLDLSIVADDEGEAEKIAKANNQEAYYDLGAGRTVIVKNDAERRRAATGSLEQAGREANGRVRTPADGRKRRRAGRLRRATVRGDQESAAGGDGDGPAAEAIAEAARLLWVDYPGGKP